MSARALRFVFGALLALVAASGSSASALAQTPSTTCDYVNASFSAGYTQSGGTFVYDPSNFKPGERLAYDITSPGGGSLKVFGTVDTPVDTTSGQGMTTVTGLGTVSLRIEPMTVAIQCLQPLNNTYLWSLTPNNGVLVPSFSYLTANYTASVPNSVSSITLTPTTDEPAATVTVNGTTVTGPSIAVPLAIGANTITIVVTSASGLATRTYTLTLSRQATAPATNANLSNLSLSTGALTPGFSSGTTSYAQSVANGVSTVTVTPTADDASATVTVNGSPIAPGQSTTMSLEYGPNTITTVVTAQDRTTTKTYTSVLTRQPNAGAGDNDLSNLAVTSTTLSPAFDRNITSYTATVTNTSVIRFTPTLSDANASLTVNGTGRASGAQFNQSLSSSGTTVVNFRVAAENGTPKTYTVTITATYLIPTLTGISLSDGALSPAYDQGVSSYTSSVANNVTSLTVTPTAATLNQVTVNGSVVASGAASAPIALAVGQNSISVVVRARSGSNTKTYTVAVTRQPGAASGNADLSGIGLSAGTLTPSFAANTISYTTTVANGVASLTLTPTLDDANAAVKVNGNTVASGSPSGAIPLNVGNNTITTEVTAQDGTTTKTYTVAVTRQSGAASANADLSGLGLSAGTLTPSFAANTISYATTVANGVASLTLTPTLDDANATVKVNGNTVASGSPSGAISLNVGANTIATVATAENGSTKTYTVTVTRAAPPVSITFTPAGSALPDAMASEAYAAGITTTANSNNTPIFSISAGALPPGLTLNVSTGELTGPLATISQGNYSFTISVTDSAGGSGSASYTLRVMPRAITVTDKTQSVPAGPPPPNVYLNSDATGGPFTDAKIVAVSPENSGTATIIQGELAAATPSGPFGYYLKFKPTPGFKGQAKVSFVLTSALGTSNVGIVTYNVAYDPGAVAVDFDGKVRDFVKARQNLIATNAKTPGLLERRRMTKASRSVETRVTPSGEEGVNLGIATSLVGLRAARNNGAGAMQPLNVWIDGTLMAQKRDETDGGWGSFGMFSVGADYLLTPATLIGISLHVDRMTDPSDDESVLRGTGWLAGPYVSLEIVQGVIIDTNLLYGGSSNDIGTAFFNGTFETNRWMWSAKIAGQWRADETTLVTPKLGAVYLNEQVEDYGIGSPAGDRLLIAGFTEEQIRVSVGADFEKQYLLESGLVLVPRLGVTAGVASLDNSGLFGSLTTGFSLSDGMSWDLDAALLLSLESEGQVATGGKLGGTVRF
ncbi:cadherin-like beta sandwich domain-containing protein [Hyphomicrobium sp.]|uniref:cadherin-like beta sandwich domain-containing protein n=1 Tax=Hyphomicrobium sp. TaxID=82 RepID=UPI003F7106BA